MEAKGLAWRNEVYIFEDWKELVKCWVFMETKGAVLFAGGSRFESWSLLFFSPKQEQEQENPLFTPDTSELFTPNTSESLGIHGNKGG